MKCRHAVLKNPIYNWGPSCRWQVALGLINAAAEVWLNKRLIHGFFMDSSDGEEAGGGGLAQNGTRL